MAKIKKLEVIYNRKAGNGQSKDSWEKVAEFLGKNDINFKMHQTKQDGDGVRIAKILADGLDPATMILVIGATELLISHSMASCSQIILTHH